MAEPQPTGGLGAMAPKPQNPAQDAARISGMEQSDTPQDRMNKVIQEKKDAEEALTRQMAILRQSYGVRSNMPFDTSLMAAASGFLKPTKTGSFGESLGSAAEAYATDYDKALLRKQQAAKQDLELLQAEEAIKSKNRQYQQLLELSGYDPSKATTLTGGPSVSSGAPSGGTAPSSGPAGAPSTEAPSQGAMPPAQRGMKQITEEDILRGQVIGGKEQAGLLTDLAKMQRDRYIVVDGNLYDKVIDDFVKKAPPNQKPGKYDFGEAAGVRETTPDVYNRYRQILEKGTQEDLWNFYKGEQWITGKFPGNKASASAPAASLGQNAGAGTTGVSEPGGPSESNPFGLRTRFESAEEKKTRERAEAIEDAAQKASREALERLRAEGGEKRASNLIGLGESAQTTRNLAKDMNSFAKSNPRIFDLLQSPDILDRVVKFGEQGIKFGQFGSFSIPATVLAQNKYLGITQGDLDALQMFAQANAKLTVELRKQSRSPGEGSTTESEGTLYATVEALPSNSSRVILLKNDLLELRSDFNEQAAKLWVEYSEKNPGKSFDSFRLHSQDFKELRSAYDKALDVRRKVTAEILGDKPKEGAKPAAPQSAAPTAAPAGNKPNERVIGGTIWERKPDGSWKNTERKP
jgi:hypothetical protein